MLSCGATKSLSKDEALEEAANIAQRPKLEQDRRGTQYGTRVLVFFDGCGPGGG